jgi:Fanconi-associated nuclease 1
MSQRLLPAMILTVAKHELHLFTHDEWRYIDRYTLMSCKYARYHEIYLLSFNSDQARYLLIRLCLRKENKWHRLDQLKYQQEIGDKSNIVKAIKELCGGRDNDTETQQVEVKQEERDIIDLTLDDDEESAPVAPKVEEAPPVEEQPSAGPSRTSLTKNSDARIVFAEDESQITLPELLNCLSVDELKKLGKQLKLKVNLNVCLQFLLEDNQRVI